VEHPTSTKELGRKRRERGAGSYRKSDKSMRRTKARKRKLPKTEKTLINTLVVGD